MLSRTKDNPTCFCVLQLFVVATDGATQDNARSTTVTVEVLVDRNVAPVIQNPNNYITTTSEGVDVDEPIVTIVATDANPDVSNHSHTSR